MIQDVGHWIYLNDKFLSLKLEREVMKAINYHYGFIGPLILSVFIIIRMLLETFKKITNIKLI